MKCPACSTEIENTLIISEFQRIQGSKKSKKKTLACRKNAKLGGWPKGKPRKDICES